MTGRCLGPSSLSSHISLGAGPAASCTLAAPNLSVRKLRTPCRQSVAWVQGRAGALLHPAASPNGCHVATHAVQVRWALQAVSCVGSM